MPVAMCVIDLSLTTDIDEQIDHVLDLIDEIRLELEDHIDPMPLEDLEIGLRGLLHDLSNIRKRDLDLETITNILRKRLREVSTCLAQALDAIDEVRDSPCVDYRRVRQLAAELEDEVRNIIDKVKDVVHTLEQCIFLEWVRV